jgi:hypothetical protein
MPLFAEAAVGRTWFVELQSATSSLANPTLSIGVSLEVARSAKKWETNRSCQACLKVRR